MNLEEKNLNLYRHFLYLKFFYGLDSRQRLRMINQYIKIQKTEEGKEET